MAGFRCVLNACACNKLDVCQMPHPCDKGRFETFVCLRLGHLGAWRVRQYGGGDALCAKLKGRSGYVELWGGSQHRTEVWFIERGTRAETMLFETEAKESDEVVSAVEKACAMAGVQTRMEV